MIIFAKADGTVVETKPTPFYQGSSLKGSIYLVAPFPNTNGVTIQFQMPNGNVTKAYPMTPTGEVEGVMLDGYEVSAWTWDVKNAMVTAIPGMVTATITVFNGEPNITYYGDYETLAKITVIENPQTNAYAYCRDDGKVYKYNGNTWTESNITISANDYVKTTIVSSFPIIKGTPNALDVSTPSASEWEAIISALGSIGGKVTMPLMTNFTYNIATGESEKSYNNGMVQTENFPAVLPDTMTEYQSFTKTTFESISWDNSDLGNYSYMLVLENSTIKPNEDFGFDIAVFRLISSTFNRFEKMDPFIVVNFNDSNVKIYSNATYSGYVLFFWKGSFAEQNYLPAINTAIENANTATANAETATANANTATANAETIANTLGTAYENGELGIPSGGIAGQVLTKTASGTAWEDAPSGGGSGGNTYFFSPPCYAGAYSGYEWLFMMPPLDEIAKIELIELYQYDHYNYTNRVHTVNQVIYENGTKNSITVDGIYLDSSGSTYSVEFKWNGNCFYADIYSAWGNGATSVPFNGAICKITMK